MQLWRTRGWLNRGACFEFPFFFLNGTRSEGSVTRLGTGSGDKKLTVFKQKEPRVRGPVQLGRTPWEMDGL